MRLKSSDYKDNELEHLRAEARRHANQADITPLGESITESNGLLRAIQENAGKVDTLLGELRCQNCHWHDLVPLSWLAHLAKHEDSRREFIESIYGLRHNAWHDRVLERRYAPTPQRSNP